jgi:phage gpG-like protein
MIEDLHVIVGDDDRSGHVAKFATDLRDRLEYATPRPLLRSGELRDSITYTVNGHQGAVGTNLDYAPYLEFGTSRIPPRSFLVSSAIASQDKIYRMAGATAVAALSGHGRHARDVREMLHLLHAAGHKLKEAVDDLLDDEDSKDGHPIRMRSSSVRCLASA